MQVINDIYDILSMYSEEEPLNQSKLYTILKINYGYSDEVIDEAIDYMIENEFILKRGTNLAYVVWINPNK